MTVPRLLTLALGLVVILGARASGEDSETSWEFLSRTTIRAETFVRDHPEWDGRGVLVAICDSGTELGLPGLATTTDGKPKIVDARVFSDEGLISLARAQRVTDDRGAAWKASGERRLYGITELDPQPAEGADVLLGWFEEKKHGGGRMTDMNADGRSDGVFGVVAFRAAGAEEGAAWTAFIDRDGDGELSDEKPLHDYAVARDTFRLTSANPDHQVEEQVLYALNLDPAAREAVLYFGAGHGTHVAGITAGHRLNGRDEFDGIAPGAQILALKIGNDSLSGGATTPGSMLRAWRHAVTKAKELGLPLIIQMSYGVGSEDEGGAVSERLIDKLLRDNPEVVATVSAGNEGPGISTIGLPSCAKEPLSIGASFARTTARDVSGVDLPDDRMFAFSSRGGEVAKPEVVTPGFAASSVPDWFGGRDVMRGTSMAAPQAAGACALLYSAVVAEGLPVRRDVLRAALVRSARKLPGYGVLDQGAGMIDVPRAFDVYRALIDRGEHRPVTWKVEVESPELGGKTGETVFYRGDFYPRDGERVTVRARPVFVAGTPDETKRRFFQAFDLTCDGEFVDVAKDASYAKQSAAVEIPLIFRAERMRVPGLYQAEVLAYDKAAGADRSLGPEFRVPVSVVIPHRLAGGAPVTERLRGIEASLVRRMFLQVDAGTASVQVEARTPGNASARLMAFDPEGRSHRLGGVGGDTPRMARSLDVRDGGPGVWEICVTGGREATAPIEVDLTVDAVPLVSVPPQLVELTHEAGKTPQGSFEVTAAVARTWRGNGSGRLTGWSRREEHAVRGPWFRRTYALSADESGLTLDFEMSARDWGLFTDVAIRVRDRDGVPVRGTAMGYRRERLHFMKGDAKGPFKLEVYGGTADPAATKVAWTLAVRETRLLANAVNVSARGTNGRQIVLYPDRPATLRLSLAKTPPTPPRGFTWRADLTLKPQKPGGPELPMTLDLRVK